MKLATAAVVAAGAVGMAASSASAATPPPPLYPGDVQAFASLTSGGPRITAPVTRTFQGALTLSAGATVITCTNAVFTVVFNVDGTTSVTGATFTPVGSCTINIPNCNVTVTATGLPWGNRLVQNGGVFRDRINVGSATAVPPTGVVNTLTGAGCPPGGPFVFNGTLSPRITGGTGATAATRSFATFDATAGTLTNPVLGPGTVTGTVNGTIGQPLFPRL